MSNERLKAEILWTLKIVESHYSFRSAEKSAELFRLMFPDSQVAAEFKCGQTKASYLTSFGLAPHFSKLLLDCVNSSPEYVLLFDESSNHKTQTKQLDFHVRYWSDNAVRTHYLTSEFLGHSAAIDLQQKFSKVISESNFKQANLLQISMDGPSVNLNLLEKINNDMITNHNVGLLNVGSCGLHVMHNAFRRGCEASQWELESFLTSAYILFRDSPARREDYIKVTGSTSFPAKFCAHRWLENNSVAEKAIVMLPYLEKFVKAAMEKKITLPKNKSFDIVKAGVLSTPLLSCRLAFFSLIASILEPFLRKYQADQPLLPFLCLDLHDIMKNLMHKFIKSNVLNKCETALQLVQVDICNSSNHVNLSMIELGFRVDRLLAVAKKQSSVNDGTLMAFRAECRDFLKAVVLKLQDKSPLKYTLVRNITFLNPKTMGEKDKSIQKMKKVLLYCQGVKRFDDVTCDKVLSEFRNFLDSSAGECGSKAFDPMTQRLDSWFYDALAGKAEFQVLWSVVRQLLLLSHGQATVERGFSFNKETVADNLSQTALKARRVILDHIHSVGGVENVEISKPLMISASSAYGRYERYLSEQKQQKETEEKQVHRKRLGDELVILTKRLKTTSAEERHLLELADRHSFQAEEQKSFSLIERSNNMRLLAKDKKKEITKIQSDIDRLQEEIKRC